MCIHIKEIQRKEKEEHEKEGQVHKNHMYKKHTFVLSTTQGNRTGGNNPSFLRIWLTFFAPLFHIHVGDMNSSRLSVPLEIRRAPKRWGNSDHQWLKQGHVAKKQHINHQVLVKDSDFQPVTLHIGHSPQKYDLFLGIGASQLFPTTLRVLRAHLLPPLYIQYHQQSACSERWLSGVCRCAHTLLLLQHRKSTGPPSQQIPPRARPRQVAWIARHCCANLEYSRDADNSFHYFLLACLIHLWESGLLHLASTLHPCNVGLWASLGFFQAERIADNKLLQRKWRFFWNRFCMGTADQIPLLKCGSFALGWFWVIASLL